MESLAEEAQRERASSRQAANDAASKALQAEADSDAAIRAVQDLVAKGAAALAASSETVAG